MLVNNVFCNDLNLNFKQYIVEGKGYGGGEGKRRE
jgi:hypothetical protein